MPASDPVALDRYKRALAVLMVALPFWLLASPRPPSDTELTDDAIRFLAGFMFALIFAIAYGLFRPYRWPVTAARGLMASFLFGVIVGPAGRETWVYIADVAFVGAGIVLAFVLIKLPPRQLGASLRTPTFHDDDPDKP